jgi:plasmid stabilization system protein ParE
VPRHLRLTDDAEADLLTMRRWNTQPGAGPMAKKRVDAILNAIERLRDQPCLYPKGRKPGTRVLVCRGHCVVYTVNPDTDSSATAGDVLVLRVLGPGQSRDGL